MSVTLTARRGVGAALTVLLLALGIVVVTGAPAHADVHPAWGNDNFVAVDLGAVSLNFDPPVAAKSRAATLYLHVELAGGRNQGGPCLDGDSDTIQNNGTRVQIWGCNETIYQRWFFMTTGVTGLYQVQVGVFPGRCLDEENSFGGVNATVVQLWDCRGVGQHNQFWWVVGTEEHGAIQLRNHWNGKCLTIDDNPTFRNGSRARVWDCGDRASFNSQWFHVKDLPAGGGPIT